MLPLDEISRPSVSGPVKFPLGVMTITGCAALAPGWDCWLSASIRIDGVETLSVESKKIVQDPVTAL